MTIQERVFYDAEPAMHVVEYLDHMRLRRIRNQSIATLDRRRTRR